ncbi:hypothetical protein Tco_0950021 [Tanacetum coccineum]
MEFWSYDQQELGGRSSSCEVYCKEWIVCGADDGFIRVYNHNIMDDKEVCEGDKGLVLFEHFIVSNEVMSLLLRSFNLIRCAKQPFSARRPIGLISLIASVGVRMKAVHRRLFSAQGIGSSGPQIDFISEVTQATHQSGRYQQMRSRSHVQQPQLDPCRQFPFSADNITSKFTATKVSHSGSNVQVLALPDLKRPPIIVSVRHCRAPRTEPIHLQDLNGQGPTASNGVRHCHAPRTEPIHLQDLNEQGSMASDSEKFSLGAV